MVKQTWLGTVTALRLDGSYVIDTIQSIEFVPWHTLGHLMEEARIESKI